MNSKNYYVNEHAVVDEGVEIGEGARSGIFLIYKKGQRSASHAFLDKM